MNIKDILDYTPVLQLDPPENMPSIKDLIFDYFKSDGLTYTEAMSLADTYINTIVEEFSK